MTGPIIMKVEITVAWWFEALYMPGVQAMMLLGFTPDPGKVLAVAKKAVRARIVSARDLARLSA